MPDLKSFGRWLQRKIEQVQTNQSGLAAYWGVSPSAVSDWIKGNREPNEENIRAMSRVLRVPIEDIYAALGRIPPSEEEGLTAGGRRLLALLRELPPEYQDAVADTAESVAKALQGKLPTGSPDSAEEA